MNKLYVKKHEPHYIDTELYAPEFEEELKLQNVSLYGNPDYTDQKTQAMKDAEELTRALLDADILNDGTIEFSYDGFENYSQFTNYYAPKENGKRWSGQELHRLKTLNIALHDGHLYASELREVEKNIMLEILYITTGKHYDTGIINGIRQSDWVYYCAPVDTTKDFLDWVEAIYFGTGTEWQISETASDDDTYWAYTPGHDVDDLARWIGANPEDIIELNSDEDFEDYFVPAMFRELPYFWRLYRDNNEQSDEPYTPAELSAWLYDLMLGVPELTPEEAISAAYDELQWI